MTVATITFLNLGAGLLAAGVALPALLALYLLKLRRRPVRVSSTLLWTQVVQDLEVNVPLRWLKASLLLVLHLLTVVLLCLAIARPALTDGSAGSQRAIILIDRSASMSAVESPGEPSRLERARSLARDMVQRITDAGRPAAIVAFASQPVLMSGFSTSASALNAAISDASPTDQPTDLAAALQLADSLVSGGGAEESPEPVDVILISDGNIPDPPRMLSTAGQLRYISVVPPAGPEARTPAPNLAITSLSARRDDADPATVRVFARVQSTFPSSRTIPLALSLNAEPVQRRPVDVPGISESGTPGEATATFELVEARAGVLLLTLPDADALASDNAAALVLPASDRPDVLLVQPPAVARTEDPQGDLSPDWLLGDALKEMSLGSLRRVSAAQAAAMASNPATAPDLVIYDRVRADPLPPIATLSFGVPLDLPGVRSVVPAATADAAASAILTWDRTHPVLRDVALDTLLFTRPIRFEIDDEKAREARVEIAELARGPAGPAILSVQHPTAAGVTRRIALAFELQQSNWPVSVGFPIFLANAIDFLTLRAEQSAGIAFSTNQPAWLSPGGRSGVIDLDGPIRLTCDVPQGAPPGSRVSLGLIERAGVYAAPGAPLTAVAINLADGFESSLRGRESIPIAGREITGDVSAVGSRELWRWLLMAAAALMAVEWFLHAARARV
jgi:hypothetical protein